MVRKAILYEEWYPVYDLCDPKRAYQEKYVKDIPEDLYTRYQEAKGNFVEVQDEFVE